jgi:hypothetical protein
MMMHNYRGINCKSKATNKIAIGKQRFHQKDVVVNDPSYLLG